MTERREADHAADAWLSGDPAGREAIRHCADRHRVADLLVVHALMARLQEEEVERGERVLCQSIDRIVDLERPRYLRRLLPTAIAALLMVSFLAAWWFESSTHRAVADLALAYSRQGLRRYQLTIRRDDPFLPQLSGIVDLDGTGNSIVSVDLPPGAPQPRVLWGHSSDGWWCLQGDGSIARSLDRTVVDNWVHQHAGDVPVPSVDETLAQFERKYKVDWSIDPKDQSLVYHGVLDPAIAAIDRNLADEVFIRYNTQTARIRGVRWIWAPAAGSIAKITEVSTVLAEKRPVTEGWFEPELHLDGSLDRLPSGFEAVPIGNR